MSFNYRLNSGQYVLYDGDEPIGPLLEEVAICFDKESGTRHKVGAPTMVNRWYEDSRKKLLASKDPVAQGMANDLVLIQGRFTLEDINRVLDITGYPLTLYKKLQDGTCSFLDMHGCAHVPSNNHGSSK